jgi:hypothetical protein
LNKINAQLVRLWRRKQNQQEIYRENLYNFCGMQTPYLNVLDKNSIPITTGLNQVEAEFVQQRVLQNTPKQELALAHCDRSHARIKCGTIAALDVVRGHAHR